MIPILDEPQFSQADALAVCEMTAGELKGMIDREQVRLRRDHNPGSGRRRLYAGSDILKLKTGRIMSPLGFPLRWLYLLADQVEQRASARLVGLDITPKLRIATYPISDGDWAQVPIWDGMTDPPKLPLAVQILEVDRLIDEMLARLQALIEEKPLPSFEVPAPEAEPSPYSPENDFFLRWAKDEQGRDVMVGLTYEETAEYQAHRDRDLLHRLDDNSFPWPSVEEMHREKRRSIELHDKHELARLKRLGDTYQDRLGEPTTAIPPKYRGIFAAMAAGLRRRT